MKLSICLVALAGLAASTTMGCWRYVDVDEPSGPSPTGQTYKDAVAIVCDVDRLAEIDPNEPDELADVRRLAYLEANIDNGDGIALRTMLSVRFGEARACLLEDARTEVGIESCELQKRSETSAATP